jgi:hypothetical protein
VQQDSIGKSVNLFLNMDTAEIELESNPSEIELEINLS